MLKRNILKFIVILIGILAIYFLKPIFTEYNLKKSISACVLGKKRTSESFDLEKAKKFCEKEIRMIKQN